MRKWTMTAGLLFCAAASVYSNQAIGAKGEEAAKPTGNALPPDVKLLDDQTNTTTTGTTTVGSSSAPAPTNNGVAPSPAPVDPFASESDPVPQPTTQPEPITEVIPSAGGPAAPLHLNSDGTFSLNIVNGADLVEQLRVIGFQAQMSIIPSKDVRGSLPAVDLYNVTVTEALDALLHANGYAWRQKGNFIYVYSEKELAEMEKAQRVMNTAVFRLHYTPAANAVNMIKPVLSNEGQVSFTAPAVSGIESGAKDVGGNSHATEDVLVVTDYPENLDRVRAVIREVDQRPQQVLIEATILRATLTENNALGVDFNVVGGVDFSTISTSSGQFTDAGVTDGDNLDTFDTPAHSAGTGNSFSSPIAGGLKVGVVTNNVSVFLAALEGVTDTTVLANPKVLALNKQKGEVIVGSKDGYLTTTLTDTTATQTVEFLETGTRLIFRPYIGGDGYIRMEIHPEDSSGFVNEQGLPSKFTTEVTSNVMVRDGHTIVIGGLFRESSSSTRSQVPIVGNIPLVGHLFKNQTDRTTREEVIILITPHIVKDDSLYAQLSEEQLKDAERMRVGVRRGMMFWGRERMADLYYNTALRELSKPNADRKKAIFFLNAATGLNPQFIEAINLKRELTGRELATADGSSIRSFVRNAMMVDHGAASEAESMEELDAMADEPTTQPFAEGPTTQPLAEGPSTQPTGDDSFAVEPIDLDAQPEPFEFTGGFTPATPPIAGEFESSDAWEMGEDGTMPLAETDMEEPSYLPLEEELPMPPSKFQPVVTVTVPSTQPTLVQTDEPDFEADDAVRWTTPTTHPAVATGGTNGEVPQKGATTQPSQGIAGVRGLGAVMGEMLKNNDAQKQQPKQSDDTSVTELPTEELPGGDNK